VRGPPGMVRRPSRTPAGGGLSLSLDLARTRTHAIPHHHIRGLLPAGLHRELVAHAQTAAVEAVHPPRQLRLLRLVGVALRAAPGAQRRRQPAVRHGDREGGDGRRQKVAAGRGRRREPRRPRLVQVLRLLRDLCGQLPRRVPPQCGPSAPAHCAAGRHLVPHLPGAELRRRRLSRQAAHVVAARLRRVRRLLPVHHGRAHRAPASSCRNSPAREIPAASTGRARSS
jgi:hypothetical protein